MEEFTLDKSRRRHSPRITAPDMQRLETRILSLEQNQHRLIEEASDRIWQALETRLARRHAARNGQSLDELREQLATAEARVLHLLDQLADCFEIPESPGHAEPALTADLPLLVST